MSNGAVIAVEDSVPSSVSAAGIAAVILMMESWLLDRTAPNSGSPVSIRAQLKQWWQAFRSRRKGRTNHRLFSLRCNLGYDSLGSAPHMAVMFQKGIFQRLLFDESRTWLKGRHWPVALEKESVLRFSPFSTYLALALHNALCIAASIRNGHPADSRRFVAEFARQARRTMPQATLGDLLAAHLVVDAIIDLVRVFDEAAPWAGKRRIIDAILDYIYRRRWHERRKAAFKLQAWAGLRLREMFAPFDPLAPLLDDAGPWVPEQLGRAAEELVRRHPPIAMGGWLAWRISRFIRGEHAAVMLAPLWAAVQRGLDPSLGFVGQVVIEALAALPRTAAEKPFAELCRGEPSFARVCGALAYHVLGPHPRPHSAGGIDPIIRSHLEQAVARAIPSGVRSGVRGQIFVGEFLAELTSLFTGEFGPGRFESLAGAMPLLELPDLCRNWFRATHGGFAELRDKVSGAHPDLARMRRIQESVDEAIKRSRAAYRPPGGRSRLIRARPAGNQRKSIDRRLSWL